MSVIFLALGSNVGDSQANIQRAVELLGKKISNIQQTQLYRSAALPVPDHPNLPDFVNTAIKGETNLTPQELLKFTQQTEKEVGKVYRFHWGPREIDIDIIFYDNQIIDEPNLKIPHPHAHERDFVLQPLAAIEPNFIDPASKKSLKELLDSLPATTATIL